MTQNLLEHINSPTDLKNLSQNQLPQLAKELRDFIFGSQPWCG
jgi:1-deoxy-D-xylulose-5-phosphate synthase